MTPTQQQRKMAACGYLWILSFVVAYQYKTDPFISAHARQGMILTLISFLVLFIPLDVLVIALELLFVLLAVMGFYRAYQGESFTIVGEAGIGLHFRPQDWEVTSLEYNEQSSRAEQERAALAYIPFLALWFLWREEGRRFVRIHSLYALWIQLLACAIGIILVLPGSIVAFIVTLCSVYGVVLALQGTWDLFPHSTGWVRRYQSFYAPWYLCVAICSFLWNKITEHVENVPMSIPALYQHYEQDHRKVLTYVQERVRTAHVTEHTWQYASYILGPLVLLIKRTPLLVHHAVQGSILLIMLSLGIYAGSSPLLYLTALLLIWFLLQVRSNTITLLPGSLRIELRLLSTFFPTTHE